MAHFSKPGRAHHVAILAWFVQTAYPLVTGETRTLIPEPPIEPVRRAFLWQENRRAPDRLPGAVRRPPSDRDLDGAYEEAERIVSRRRVTDPLASEDLRRTLLDERPLGGFTARVEAAKAAITHSVVLQAFGLDEVGAEGFAALMTQSRTPVLDGFQLDNPIGLDVTAELLTPRGRPQTISAASDEHFRSARDLARTLIGHAALTRILRWTGNDGAAIDRVVHLFQAHGFGLLVAPGITHMEPLNLVPVISMFLEPRFYSAGSNLSGELGVHPFTMA